MINVIQMSSEDEVRRMFAVHCCVLMLQPNNSVKDSNAILTMANEFVRYFKTGTIYK